MLRDTDEGTAVALGLCILSCAWPHKCRPLLVGSLSVLAAVHRSHPSAPWVSVSQLVFGVGSVTQCKTSVHSYTPRVMYQLSTAVGLGSLSCFVHSVSCTEMVCTPYDPGVILADSKTAQENYSTQIFWKLVPVKKEMRQLWGMGSFA